MARTGKTREHYLRQKSQAFAYFRVRQEDAQLVSSGQFTVFDFISNCFSFSTAKKQVAADVLASLKAEPQTFKQLQEALGVGKSTWFWRWSARVWWKSRAKPGLCGFRKRFRGRWKLTPAGGVVGVGGNSKQNAMLIIFHAF